MESERPADPSRGYEAHAREFAARRDRSAIGVRTVREWARTLPAGGTVLDLGCGSGAPISAALIEEGLSVYGVDASPTLVQEFRARFPDSSVEHAPVETSRFFGRAFDGVMVPDHVPELDCPAPWHAGHAYTVGYMRALVQNAAALGPSWSVGRPRLREAGEAVVLQ